MELLIEAIKDYNIYFNNVKTNGYASRKAPNSVKLERLASRQELISVKFER